MALDSRSAERVAEHLVVLRAQLGDRDAYGGLFERYNSRLLYYLRRLMGSPADAEDVLQEVWITVVRRLNTLDQPEAFKAWIYRIAHNRAISKLRRARREIPIEDLPVELEVDPQSVTGDELDLFGAFDAGAIQLGLERLSAPHREVLTLRFVDDLSYEEISEIVGCAIGTVRSRLHYAKKTLHRDLLEKKP
ncbi:MAG: sigma-70 family RNA polymerase sigma factor [Thermoanaerobaculia bacterium]|nr:sigma-70 family RNA polymerase sigma factor [Thermoanaerobaculia bacterium]